MMEHEENIVVQEDGPQLLTTQAKRQIPVIGPGDWPMIGQ